MHTSPEQADKEQPMNQITEPLRLAVGSHAAGSGKGCAMNLISWENGDTTITDLPDCADQTLARMVQRVNDHLCTHRDGDLLCPACSMTVLELAHRTVGTGKLPLTDRERHVAWVKIAADQARQVLHLVPDRDTERATHAIELAERWAQDPTSVTTSDLRHAAADAAAYAAYAADAAAYAADAAAAYADAAADAAASAAAAYADAYAARAHALKVCADIVRQHYPTPPEIAL
jgi:hypothetical protein